MRRNHSAPSSLLPLRTRAAPSGSSDKIKPKPLWRQRLPIVCLSCIVALFVARTFILPHAVRSERWTERDDQPKLEKVECPRWWDGGSGVIEEPKGPWRVPPPTGETRVFVYTVVASTAESVQLLQHFLDFYTRRAGVPAERLMATVHASHKAEPHAAALAALIDDAGAHRDLWTGTFTSETKAWHRDEVVRRHLAPTDWLVVADVDELHQFPGVRRHDGSPGPATPADKAPVVAFLETVGASGANYVLATWEDRVAEGGHLNHVSDLSDKDAASALEAQFPLRCTMTEWTKPRRGLAQFLPRAEAHKVVASRAYLKIHRSAHKVKPSSYAYSALNAATLGLWGRDRYAGVRGSTWPTPFTPRAHGGPDSGAVVSQHYKWVAGLVPYLDRRVRVYETCGMLWSYESAALVERLEENRGRVCVTCGELACAHAEPRPRRRVAIVTSVWDEHVDGVSITMNRVAAFLNDQPDEDVLVLTPHDPQVPEPVMKGLGSIPKFTSGSVPVFALIGRDDYVMGAPLGADEKRALLAYDPDIYHLVSPDILGFSAQQWARASGVCSVCTYHTQLDRYVRFYTAKHSFLDAFKPRIAVQKLFSTFYGGCDVVAVPNEAIADKLALKMRIPREKIGFFPRGVNTTHYHPGKRSGRFRRDVFGAGDRDLVVLWAARLVPEKGTGVFVDAIASLFANETLRKRHAAVLDRVRVAVVGTGKERKAMEARLPAARTRFAGHLSGEDLRAAYASSDVYFFPSHTEAFPNTLLEAQASGLAVLAPAYSVNKALVPPSSGHLVDEHANAEEFADGLFALLKDAAYRARIGRNAVEVARNRTWAKAFDGLRSCYDRCASLGKRVS